MIIVKHHLDPFNSIVISFITLALVGIYASTSHGHAFIELNLVVVTFGN